MQEQFGIVIHPHKTDIINYATKWRQAWPKNLFSRELDRKNKHSRNVPYEKQLGARIAAMRIVYR